MKKLLIVEDEAALRDIYVMLFKSHGEFEVHEASNGKVAVRQLDKVKPDVIILDILMPVMTGIEFLEKVEIKKKYPKTKVLVLSNLSDSKTLSKINDLGADTYILKSSSSPTKLVESVKKLLKK